MKDPWPPEVPADESAQGKSRYEHYNISKGMGEEKTARNTQVSKYHPPGPWWGSEKGKRNTLGSEFPKKTHVRLQRRKSGEDPECGDTTKKPKFGKVAHPEYKWRSAPTDSSDTEKLSSNVGYITKEKIMVVPGHNPKPRKEDLWDACERQEQLSAMKKN